MITTDGLHSRHTWRPLLRPLVLLVAWDVLVTVLYLTENSHVQGLEVQLSVFGTAIALFVGVMVNAAYARWWEARTLWGQVVNSSRSLARQSLVLIGADQHAPSPRARSAVRALVAYVHLLRTSLRRQDPSQEAEQYLTPQALARVRAATNKPTAVLSLIDEEISTAYRAGEIGEISRVQMEAALVALTDAQGGLERIKNTPMPLPYRFLPKFFSRAFCVVLPFAVVADLGWATPIGSGLVSLMFLLAIKAGDDLSDPFEDGPHDVPMTALCATIEIDLTEMLGAEPPVQVTPVDTVLW